MKIAYLVYYDVTKVDGVVKKINSQVGEWRDQGNQVEIFSFVPTLNETILNSKLYSVGANWVTNRFYLIKELVTDINDFSPDIIYFRGESWNRTVGEIFKKYPSVVEVNTDQSSEFRKRMFQERNLKSVFRYLGNNYFSYLLYKDASGIVGVTHEISLKFHGRKRKVITIPNSINTDKLEPKKKNNELKTSLFFMGSPNQSWHGLDIIELIANEFSDYDFHIIGISKENGPNLFYHGFLDFSDYIQIVSRCHIGIGTLALFRKSMKEACPLKVREYIGLGFPIIIGYEDSAFKNQRPEWVHVIDPQNIDFKSLKSFIESYRNYIVSDMSFVESKVIEKNRLAFFKNVLENGN